MEKVRDASMLGAPSNTHRFFTVGRITCAHASSCAGHGRRNNFASSSSIPILLHSLSSSMAQPSFHCAATIWHALLPSSSSTQVLHRHPFSAAMNGSWNVAGDGWRHHRHSVCFCFRFSGSSLRPTAQSQSHSHSHGKKVYTSFRVIGIPGDGRCLFRAVAHGLCTQQGKPTSNEESQRELADELRQKAVDELVKRRSESEWFIEENFDKYTQRMRQYHVWGGEPELLMLSHVLKLQITVFMAEECADGIIAIAEYGQDYSKENPLKILYHGYGHYDALVMH